jgi:hypothetical protein
MVNLKAAQQAEEVTLKWILKRSVVAPDNLPVKEAVCPE